MEQFLSPDWYRVSHLQLGLKPHLKLHKHVYREQLWFVLSDPASGRTHRFNPETYRFIGLLDGVRSVGEIWEQLCDTTAEDAPSQGDVIQVLAQLHGADLLSLSNSPDLDELSERGGKARSNKVAQYFKNPMLLRLPLWDPDAFLVAALPRLRWLFSWPVALLWLAAVIWAVATVGAGWQAFSAGFSANALSPNNLIIMLICYPFIKLTHELGHALAARRFGCEVHEMGVAFLLFMPIPYVDVSPTNALPDKYQRILVSSAGILVELFIAALGVWLWTLAEPGLARDVAYALMLIGGLSTLLFNGNPLLKYDGYYVLADYLEIPGLYERAVKYMQYLLKRYLLGVVDEQSPVQAPGERGWFLCYGPASLIYRLALMWVIVVFVTDSLFVVGVVLALLLVWRQLLSPCIKGLNYVFSNPALNQKRGRGLVGALLASAVTAAVLILPVPSFTAAEGIIWVPEEAHIRAKLDGFSGPLMIDSQLNVEKDTELLEIDDPFLEMQVALLEAKHRELEARLRAEWDESRISVANLKAEIDALQEELSNARNKLSEKLVLAPAGGRLAIVNASDIEGRYFRKGDLIGYVLAETLPVVRVVVPQSDIGRLQDGVEHIDVRLVNRFGTVLPARIIRQTPEAVNRLPSAALATIYGGRVRIQPGTADEPVTTEKVFFVDLQFKYSWQEPLVGQRVLARFYHGSESVGEQIYRRVRQMFLRQFDA